MKYVSPYIWNQLIIERSRRLKPLWKISKQQNTNMYHLWFFGFFVF